MSHYATEVCKCPHLDLPRKITGSGEISVKYTYLSDGSKSKAERSDGTGLVYRGSLTYRKAANGSLTLEGADVPEGRLTPNGLRMYVTDHLGSVRAVVDGATGNLYTAKDYEAYGTSSMNATGSSYLTTAPTGETFRQGFTGQEDQGPDFSLPYTDYGARQYSPALRRWLVPDSMSEKYYGISPYAYCANYPVNLVDPEGLAWVPRCDPSGELLGFDWIDDEMVAQQDGQLPEGIYHQAIYFTDNGTFNSRLRKNIGSSIAVVYLADGTIQTYDACTYPSNLSKYPTIPEGCYEASVGAHKDSYTALKMYDIGKSKDDNTIALGFVNPAYTKRTYAEGIDIHKAGLNNFTGMTQDGKPVSAGCLLIDINQWDEFIGHFKNKDQRDNKVGVIVSRSYSSPRIPNYLKYYPYKYVDGMYK